MEKKNVEETGKVILVFPQKEPQMLEAAGLPNVIQKAQVELEELLNWFKSYKVDSIELTIEGTAKTGTIPSLLISAEGKGGMKVILKPKQSADQGTQH